MLIHNGGSVFHDFQFSTNRELNAQRKHSYTLSELMNDPDLNKDASELVWDWLIGEGIAPELSITKRCHQLEIPVLMFTIPGADFWHLFRGGDAWGELGKNAFMNFAILRERLRRPFHYVCMGSAVVHPEVFTKAIAGIQTEEFRADVVDFLDMYRPRTRVSIFGHYYKMTHKEYLEQWMKE